MGVNRNAAGQASPLALVFATFKFVALKVAMRRTGHQGLPVGHGAGRDALHSSPGVVDIKFATIIMMYRTSSIYEFHDRDESTSSGWRLDISRIANIISPRWRL